MSRLVGRHRIMGADRSKLRSTLVEDGFISGSSSRRTHRNRQRYGMDHKGSDRDDDLSWRSDEEEKKLRKSLEA